MSGDLNKLAGMIFSVGPLTAFIFAMSLIFYVRGLQAKNGISDEHFLPTMLIAVIAASIVFAPWTKLSPALFSFVSHLIAIGVCVLLLKIGSKDKSLNHLFCRPYWRKAKYSLVARSLGGSVLLFSLVYLVIWAEGQTAFSPCRSARCAAIEFIIGSRETGFLQLVLTSLIATILGAVVLENSREIIERWNGRTKI